MLCRLGPSNAICRTFDVAGGEHPVKWLIDTMSVGEGILEALWSWLDEIAPGQVGSPFATNPAVSKPNMANIFSFVHVGRTFNVFLCLQWFFPNPQNLMTQLRIWTRTNSSRYLLLQFGTTCQLMGFHCSQCGKTWPWISFSQGMIDSGSPWNAKPGKPPNMDGSTARKAWAGSR